MSRLWLMVRKDLLRQLRAPMSMLLVLSFPLVFATLIALAFGGAGGSGFPKVDLLVEDRDDSMLSRLLLAATESEQMAQYFDARPVGPEGIELIEKGEASALLRIPEGFGRNLLDGTPVTFELVRNPAQGILPEIAEQSMMVLSDFLDSASRVLREPLSEISGYLDSENGPSAAQVSSLSLKIYSAVERVEKLAIPPAILLDTVQLVEDGDEKPEQGSATGFIFMIVLPGISVWALFLLGDIAMRDILTEGQAGTLRRQLAGPLAPRDIILAKALFTALVATISLVFLASIGWFVSSATVDLPAFAVLSLAIVLAVTGWAAVVYGGAANERQGATISSVLLLIFAFIGGSFLQIDMLPAAVRKFSPLSPFYWGTTGYRELLQDGAGLVEVLPNVGVLSTLGVVLLMAGAFLMRRKVAVGGAG